MKFLAYAAIALLSACGGTGEAGNDAQDAGSSLASDLQKPMDKAAAVEQELLEQKERVDAALDEADGNTPRRR